MLLIGKTVQPKSDQLNAEDFLAGPQTFTVIDVRENNSAEQPVTDFFAGGFRPWKPCKTVRRQLIMGWTEDAHTWIGRSLRLYRDPSVLWAGKADGGIRIQAMSHIPKPIDDVLSISKGKRGPFHIEVLPPSAIPPTNDVEIARAVARAAVARGWTKDQITAAMKGIKIEDMTDEERGRFLRDLMHEPGTVSQPESSAT